MPTSKMDTQNIVHNKPLLERAMARRNNVVGSLSPMNSGMDDVHYGFGGGDLPITDQREVLTMLT